MEQLASHTHCDPVTGSNIQARSAKLFLAFCTSATTTEMSFPLASQDSSISRTRAQASRLSTGKLYKRPLRDEYLQSEQAGDATV